MGGVGGGFFLFLWRFVLGVGAWVRIWGIVCQMGGRSLALGARKGCGHGL